MSSAGCASLHASEQPQSESDTSTDEQVQHSPHDFFHFLYSMKISENNKIECIEARFGNFNISMGLHTAINSLWAILCHRKMNERTRHMAAIFLGDYLTNNWTVIVSSCGVSKYNEFYDTVFARLRAESDDTLRFHLGRVVCAASVVRTDNWPALARFVKESAASKDRTAHHALLSVCSHAPVALWDSPEVRHRIARALSSSRSSSAHLRAGFCALHNLLKHSTGDDATTWALKLLTPDFFEKCETIIVGDILVATTELMPLMLVILDKMGPKETDVHIGFNRVRLAYICKEVESEDSLVQNGLLTKIISDWMCHMDKLSDEAVQAIVSFHLLGIGIAMDFTWSETSRHKKKSAFPKQLPTGDDIENEHPEKSLARVFKCLESNRADVVMIDAALPLLNHDDWSMRAASLRGLHIYGETSSADMAATLVNCATRGIGDEDARVRFCASLLLRSIVMWHRNDLRQLFDFDYEHTLLALVPSVGNETDERVARATLEALEAVMWTTDDDVLTAHYDVLHTRLLGVLHSPLVTDLRPRALQALHCLVNVEQFGRDFPEILRSYVDGNARHFMSGTSDVSECFACVIQPPDVIIRKVCERDICDSCKCPPRWCLTCIARVVFEDLKSNHGSMITRCPFCRLSFCPEDIHYVREKEE